MEEIMARTVSFGVSGVNGFRVNVEVFGIDSMPGLEIIGLPDTSVRESKDRVNAAIINSGREIKPRRITINLAPADMKKEGPSFDLPIAVGFMTVVKALTPDPHIDMDKTAMFGELSLDGSVQPINGALPMVISAKENGMETVILPEKNAREVSCIQGIKILPVHHLKQVIHWLEGKENIPEQEQISFETLKNEAVPVMDMSQIKGQKGARRAVEVAAAGGHNMLMIGPPGAGKSMLAARLPGLLPPMTQQEILEVSMIHSVAGLLKDGNLITQRPFRDPHHSASMPALVGGSIKARPGEVSLAHRGVLFLDELPEFQRATLEALRQPLETGYVTVARANAHITYPARFQLVAAMNPCRCGYLGTPGQECSRAPKCAEEYQSKISGPLLDRIDLHVGVPAVLPTEISAVSAGESSAQVAARIQKAMEIQTQRYQGTPIIRNAEADAATLDKIVPLKGAELAFMTEAATRLHLTARSFHRILRVARTIADLAQSETVQIHHLAEALSFRGRQGV